MTEPTFDEVLTFIRETYVYRDLADVLEAKFKPTPVDVAINSEQARALANLFGHLTPEAKQVGDLEGFEEALMNAGFHYEYPETEFSGHINRRVPRKDSDD